MIRRLLATCALATTLASPASAGVMVIDPPSSSGVGFMIGVSFAFGGSMPTQPALSAHVLSNRSGWGGALGLHWYPLSPTNQLGLGVGVGYLNNRTGFVAGWDFLNATPNIGVGYLVNQPNMLVHEVIVD
jgi:hypothetical protein